MNKNEFCEFDGYNFPDIPINTKPLTKEEENKLMDEALTRAKKRKAEQDEKDIQLKLKKPSNTTSISITTAQNISTVRTNR